MDVDTLLDLRPRVSDSAIVDLLDLHRLLPARPCTIETKVLCQHWCCSQPAVSRRITRLWDADLIEYRPSRGVYHVRRLGPV